VSHMPPSFWEEPRAFEPEEAIEAEEEEEPADHGDHQHGPDCGHEAVEHGNHVDYVHDGHRHFLRDGHWFDHKG
jgi:hypothetical protein